MHNIASVIPINQPENTEMGGKILSIRVCKAPLWKTVLRYFSYICTFFLMYLFNLWIPSLHVAMTLSDCDIEKAEWVVVYGSDRNIEIVPLVVEITSSQAIKVFYYRLSKYRYYYDGATKTFEPCQFRIEKLTFRQIHTQYRDGLDEAGVKDNTIFFGKNVTDIPMISILRLLIMEILSPLYIFQAYSFVAWVFDDYLKYVILISIFSIISIAFTLKETLQIRNKLRKMSYYETPVKVFRRIEGATASFTVSSKELVPGDIIEIPERVTMPCDVLLLTGSCVMNEAMLTGEAIPVIKNAIPDTEIMYNPDEARFYTLYSGTECLQARYNQDEPVIGLVTLTGFSTLKGDLIRTMLYPKPTDFKFYSDSFKFLGILALMALIEYVVDLSSWLRALTEGYEIQPKIIIKGAQIPTVAVPPALPTCIQVGISVALARLTKRNIYCIAPAKINEAGRINVMCFDKTGTLTEPGLNLLGVRPVFFDKETKQLTFSKIVTQVDKLIPHIDRMTREIEIQNYVIKSKDPHKAKESLYEKTLAFPSEMIFEIMTTCHSLIIVRDEIIGDPLDLEMFQETKWTLEDKPQKVHDVTVLSKVKSPFYNPKQSTSRNELGIVRRFEFSSKLQRMSVIVKDPQIGFRAHMKGSPEKIRELCRPETIPSNFHTILKIYTEEGYRVLACASRVLDINYKQIKAAKREDIEKDFTFVGFLIMENKLKAATTQVIDLLHSAEVKTVMVTGDYTLTAISVARQCHIVKPQQAVYLGDFAEKKVGGKDVIVWKDFEFSENKLNENLEPELEFGKKTGRSSDVPRRFVKTFYDKDFDIDVEGDQKEEEKDPYTTLYDINTIQDKEGEKGPFIRKKLSLPLSREQEYQVTDLLASEDSCLAITGRAFSLMLSEAETNRDPHYTAIFEKMLQRTLIFARMNPEEKALLIKHLMVSQRKIVGMCGDGANDIGALKTANVGVSLSEAEASIAAPFTSTVQDINCIPGLLKEGKAALAISFQTFKFMALYSIIQASSVTILYHELDDFTNPNYYYVDILIVIPLAFAMPLSKTSGYLTKKRPIGRLMSVPVLASVIGHAIIQISFQIGIYLSLKRQSWFTPRDNGFYANGGGYETTTMFMVSIHQFCVVALALMKGPPFKKKMYTNIWFTGLITLLIIMNIIITVDPFGWNFLYDEDELNLGVQIPQSWRNTLIIVIIINTAITLVWEKIAVEKISQDWKKFKKQRKFSEALKAKND